MSCNQWEAGTIKLPTAATAAVKAAVRDASNKLHDQLYTIARDFWRDHGTRSKTKYAELLNRYDSQSPVVLAQRKLPEEARFTLQWLLESVRDKPRGLTHDDVARAVPVATNRTTSFRFSEFSIAFAGNLVRWEVGENNRACEHARAHPVAQAFFAALGRVQWTRGSGGEIVGNDEYNREADYAGGGGNYVVESFPKPKPRFPSPGGSLGARQTWTRTQMRGYR